MVWAGTLHPFERILSSHPHGLPGSCYAMGVQFGVEVKRLMALWHLKLQRKHLRRYPPYMLSRWLRSWE